MQVASNYIVVEGILVMTPPINNPFIRQGGNSEIITTVEGYGVNAAGDFSKGFVNQFPPDDQSPFIDIDRQGVCHLFTQKRQSGSWYIDRF